MKHLVLIGLMGAGKTTVGRRCAEKLGRDFVDTDAVVESLAQKSVAAIFEMDGEARFRELEQQAVFDVALSPDPLVIACGGGVVVNPTNRSHLKRHGVVIWLRAPVEVLAARVGDGSTRPLLRNDPAGALSRLAAAREIAYEAASDVQVETADCSVDDVAAAVIAAYESATA